MTIRVANRADAAAIAQLHTASWQVAYRGLLQDEFLDGPLRSNRHELWSGRFSHSQRSDQIVLIDDCAGEIQGFACVFLDADPDWGALLDNLHVAPLLKGKGLGRRLIGAVARCVLRHSAASRLHLWAYDQNLAARRFYEQLGGEVTERIAEPAPDGTQMNVVRYCWSDLSGLAGQGET
jgi:GNAT superfamily N-acetyltransferase